jgi:hypothetical protein
MRPVGRVFETPGVNFTNILHAAFAPKKYKPLTKYIKALRETFVRKSRTYNVDEIEPCFKAKRVFSLSRTCAEM